MLAIINFDNVSFIYPNGKAALKGINLHITEGEFLAVLGGNGSGKTTFCKLINGIIPHSQEGKLEGTVTVCGEDTINLSVPRLAMNVAMTLDDPDAQLFTSSVRHEAAFGPENLLLPVKEIEERVEFALEAVGLRGFENRIPSTLSGGEKQRLSIAAALAMPGKILVLDEPLARLDPKGAEETMNILASLCKKQKLTIIITSNNCRLLDGYADRICIIKDGGIVAMDETQKIIANEKLLYENGLEPPIEYDIDAVFPLESGSIDLSKNRQPVIEIKDCFFSYDKKIEDPALLNKINLTVYDNDFIGIIGANGCGKTTLLKNITGLLHPSFGDIYIRGKNTKKLQVSEISKEIGFVMQNPSSQLFTDSVYNEAAFALKNLKFSDNEIKKRVEKALFTVGLEDPNAFPHALSLGEQTKLLIACVLAMGCKIIIFDEADAGQDFKNCTMIMDIAKDLHKKGYTIIFVTHNISVACNYAQRLIIMDKEGINGFLRSL